MGDFGDGGDGGPCQGPPWHGPCGLPLVLMMDMMTSQEGTPLKAYLWSLTQGWVVSLASLPQSGSNVPLSLTNSLIQDHWYYLSPHILIQDQ